jgi:SnoaL-like domain
VSEDVTVTAGQWIERYRRAWETADADEIVDLFTPDASYRSSVFREPYLGSDAIRRYWRRSAGTQRGVAVRMGPPVITGDRVVVEWWTTMIDPDEGEITLPGCLLMRFAPDGRCRDLWEYWQVQPGRQGPSAAGYIGASLLCRRGVGLPLQLATHPSRPWP